MRLGILGGMGPMATSDFFRKVIEMTDASKDQEHIHVLIDNNTEIPDRTGYLLNHGEDPRREMIRSAIKLEMMGANLIAMPCNTAHYFYQDINFYTNVPVLNMIEETAAFVKKKWPSKKQFILLATTGTYKSKVYQRAFEKENLKLLEPDETGKAEVMQWIYQVKAGKVNVTPEAFNHLIEKIDSGLGLPVILGCTELPVLVQALNLKGWFVDPTRILAKSCVANSKTMKWNLKTKAEIA